MRFDRLDLTRYGKFTGASLSFGPALDGKPDFHVVYGDNEAGKTTAFMAILDILFGIANDNPYRFLHGEHALRVGAALEVAGGRHEVMRVWKPRALLGLDGQPLPEGLWSRELAGLDRATYTNMFSLDDRTLSEGGKSIAASKGDLGQLLFSASAGLSDFGRALVAIREETELFFKPHGRKHELAELKRQLEDLKRRKSEIDTLAPVFARLVATRNAAGADYEAALEDRARLRGALERVARRADALPRIAEWRSLRAEIAAIPEAPAVPPGWAQDLPGLSVAEVELETKRSAVAEDVVRLGKDLDDLVSDSAALAVEPRVKRAKAGLQARYLTAVKDLPGRRIAWHAAEAAVAGILADLGQSREPDPQSLLLARETMERLRDGIESWSGLEAACATATRELQSAEDQFAEATRAREAAGGDDPGAGPEVVAALRLARSGDGVARLRIAARTLDAARTALSARLAALPGWTRDAAALRALDVLKPDERLQWRDALMEAETAADRCRQDRSHLEDAVRAQQVELDLLSADGGIIDDEAARQSRAVREAAWSLHQIALDPATASDFERALRADDVLIDKRSGQMREIAELRTVRRNFARASAKAQEGGRRLAAARAELETRQAEMAERLALVLPDLPVRTLAAFDAFCERRDLVLSALAGCEGAKAEVQNIRAEMDRAGTLLGDALRAASVPFDPQAGLEHMMLAAQAAIDREANMRALREAVESAGRNLGARRRQFEDAQGQQNDWFKAWEGLCASTWLGASNPRPDRVTVRSALTLLTDLATALERQADLAGRIGKMEADLELFSVEVDEISAGMGIPADDDASKLFDAVEARLRAVERIEAARAAKIADRTQALERKRRIDAAFAVLMARKAEMTGRFGVTALADVAIALERADRRADLVERAGRLARDIVVSVGTATIEEADVVLAGLDTDALEAERVDLESRSADQDRRTQELYAARGKAYEALAAVGGDGAAAAIDEQRRTILLDIEDGVLRHLALKAGVLAAEQAVALYRERHRSSMMSSASALFGDLTRGGYAGLQAQMVKDGEVLVGLPAGGGSKLASDMSTGTRAQLYLALRIAGYGEFVKAREPVPFIMDDILETFDDSRAAAALGQLAGMAQSGQVVYLTHHRHLCAIARQICPKAIFHELGVI